MKLRTIAIALAITLASAAANAQSGAYLLFNAQMFTQEGVNTQVFHAGSQNIDRPWLLGPGYGVYYDITRLPYVGKLKAMPVIFGIDGRGQTLRDSLSEGIFNAQDGLVSLRVAATNPIKGYTPYVQGGVGIGHTKVPGRTYYSNNLFYQFSVGADTKLCKKIDWRVVEFSVGSLNHYATGFYPAGVGPNQSNYELTLGTGLVFRMR